MAEWIQLDPEQLNKNTTEKIGGVEITVGLSPYDVPDRVRGYVDDHNHKFVIEFEYLDGEEEHSLDTYGENISLTVGKHSKRLYKIHVDTNRLNTNQILLNTFLIEEIPKAIRGLEDKVAQKERHQHYEIAKDVIVNKSEELVGSI